MNDSLQTLLALGIVAITVLAFVWRAIRRGNASACGGSCGCPSQTLRKDLAKSEPDV